MKILEYKVIFFNFFLFCIFLFSCAKVTDEKDDYKYETTIEAEDVFFVLSRPDNYTNFLDFEIDGLKYSLIEYKTYGGSSIYNLFATDAITWDEHSIMRSQNRAIFDIRFVFDRRFLEMDAQSYGLGYTSEYDVLDGIMNYEKLDW